MHISCNHAKLFIAFNYNLISSTEEKLLIHNFHFLKMDKIIKILKKVRFTNCELLKASYRFSMLHIS